MTKKLIHTLSLDEHILDAIDECFGASVGSGHVERWEVETLKKKLHEIAEDGRDEFG